MFRLKSVCIASLLLVLVFAFPVASRGEQGKWTTLSSLVKKDNAFVELTAEKLAQVVGRLEKNEHMLEARRRVDRTWVYYKGDLKLDGPIDGNIGLVVDGNLRIDGLYDDYVSDIGSLVVLGDMHVEHLISWGSVAVLGNLEADGVVFTYYNDFTFEVGGSIQAEALVVSDKYADFDSSKVNVGLKWQNGITTSDVSTAQFFTAPVMAASVVDIDEGDFDSDYLYPDADGCRQVLRAGQKLFRKPVATKSLMVALEKAFDPDTDSASLLKLLEVDSLVAIAVASRSDVPELAQDKMIEMKVPEVLEVLSSNSAVGKHRLFRIAELFPSMVSNVANNENMPTEMLVGLLKPDDTESKIAMLSRSDLPVKILETLSADSDETVRWYCTHYASSGKLSAEVIDRLVVDPSTKVRVSLAGCEILGYDQLSKLAADEEPDVRRAVAERLVRQNLWRCTRTLSQTERESLAGKLYSDSNRLVGDTVVAALPPQQQLEVGRKWLAQIGDEKYQYRIIELAATTQSIELMKLILDSGFLKGQVAVAENLAISDALQQQVVSLIPHSKPRSQQLLFSFEIDLSDELAVNLLDNPNVSEVVVRKLAEHVVKGRTQSVISNTIGNLAHLSSASLEILSRFGDSEFKEFTYPFAVLNSRHSTRKQIERAFFRYHADDQELQMKFRQIAGLQDADWWRALGNSDSDKLREIAAINKNSLPETLLEMAKVAASKEQESEDVDIMWYVVANPNFPLTDDVIAKYPQEAISNPKVSEKQIELVVQNARKNDDSYSVLEDAREVMAARRLKDSANTPSNR